MTNKDSDRDWGVMAYRGGGSMLDSASAWAKQNGEVFRGTEQEANDMALKWGKQTASANVSYLPQRFYDLK